MSPIHEHTFRWRNLPHIENPGSIYFVTWRTYNHHHLAPKDRTLVMNAIQHWNQKKWLVFAAVVMPDHVHVLARPLLSHDPASTYSLGEILHSIKGFSAHEINRQRGSHGPFWQDERHDRIMRDSQELDQTWEYIVQNPVKAGLVLCPSEYPWLYQRVAGNENEAMA